MQYGRLWFGIVFWMIGFNNAGAQIVIHVMTDQFSFETKWSLVAANDLTEVFSSAKYALTPNTLFLDTIQLPLDQCYKFMIEDTGGDGIGDPGFFKVYMNGLLVLENNRFERRLVHLISCDTGDACELPKPISIGRDSSFGRIAWYSISPNLDSYYSIRARSNCDTEMWIYSTCDAVAAKDQTGAIAYNDNLSTKDPGFPTIHLIAGRRYFIRISKKEECPSRVDIEVDRLDIRLGCMDPASCNFNPLANVEDSSCYYGDCHPDLIVNQEILQTSVYLDSIINDSDCLIKEACLQDFGKRYIIRFTTQLENIGDADYIVGSPSINSSQFSLDNCHNHWHYLGYAEYLLFNASGNPLPIGFKNGFCALDFHCEEESDYKYTCDYMGISSGCYDVYKDDLLCQWVDITDVPDGKYTLVVRVNHTKSPDFFGRWEADYDNNWAQVCLQIKWTDAGPNVQLLDDCPSYTDCQGIIFGSSILDCNNECGGTAKFADGNNTGNLDAGDLKYFESLLEDDLALVEPCFDLDANGMYSVYDLFLLLDCTTDQLNHSSQLFHEHCDFPRSITNIFDSSWWKVDNYDPHDNSVDLNYRSTTSISALDLNVTEALIADLEFIHLIEDVKVLVRGSRLIIYNSNGKKILDKSDEFIPFAKIYLTSQIDSSFCIETIFDVVDERYHRILANHTSSCIAKELTTSLDDINITGVELFPNPAHHYLSILTADRNNNVSYQILSIDGRVCLGGICRVGEVINIQDLCPGLYYCKMLIGDRELVKTLVLLP